MRCSITELIRRFAGLSLLPVFLWNHLMPFNSVSALGLPIMVKKVKAVIVQTYSIASNLPTRKLLNTENLTMRYKVTTRLYVLLFFLFTRISLDMKRLDVGVHDDLFVLLKAHADEYVMYICQV